MAENKKKEATLDFEASMGRLESIVGEMEGGRLNIEDMIARFEEGRKLIKFCSVKLDEVDRKIEALVKTDEGALSTEPLDAEDGEQRSEVGSRKTVEDESEEEEDDLQNELF